MATNFDEKSAKLRHTFIRRAGIPKLIAIYRNSDFKGLNDMNFSVLCRNLLRFGPVTPEFTLLKYQLLQRYSKYRHITSNISECPGPILTSITGLGNSLL